MNSKSILAITLGIAVCSITIAQTVPAPSADGSTVPPASVALSPAVIMVRGKPGESTTQKLTIINHTPSEIGFHLSTQDVVVRDGKRLFVPAGQTANGIAAGAVASPSSVVVPAGEEASVQVTFTLPLETGQRAVVTFFQGGVAVAGRGTVGLGASLGTLITFNISSDYSIDVGPTRASPQTPVQNVILSEELSNSGSEPVVPKGVIVILNAVGKRVSKASFDAQRLLPGERLTFSATNPAQLAPGHYSTLSSFEFERKIVTNAGEFTIP